MMYTYPIIRLKSSIKEKMEIRINKNLGYTQPSGGTRKVVALPRKVNPPNIPGILLTRCMKLILLMIAKNTAQVTTIAKVNSVTLLGTVIHCGR